MIHVSLAEGEELGSNILQAAKQAQKTERALGPLDAPGRVPDRAKAALGL
jgi:hypothetical protein